MSNNTAEKLTEAMIKRPTKSFAEMLTMISEVANIAAGNACSAINKKNKLYGLRVAPPTIFHGEAISISKSDLEIVSATTMITAYGEIYLSIGFKRGEEEWMSNI